MVRLDRNELETLLIRPVAGLRPEETLITEGCIEARDRQDLSPVFLCHGGGNAILH